MYVILGSCSFSVLKVECFFTMNKDLWFRRENMKEKKLLQISNILICECG